jgi:PAS domain S-box-containing protein
MLTLRRSAEASVASEAAFARQLDALLELVESAVVRLDELGRVRAWDAAAQKLTGWHADEALGTPVDVVLTDNDGAIGALAEAVLSGRKRDPVETVLLRRDGQTLPVRASAAAEHDRADVLGVVLLVEDLSEARRSSDRLAYQAQLLASVGEAILAVDEKLVITAWNRAAQETYGWTPPEAIGRPVHDILATEFPDADYAGAVRGLFEHGSFDGEVVQRAKDGRLLRVDVHATAVRAEDGRPAGFVMVSRDVTASREAEQERARLESELRQAQKLEALGQLAAGVAHDFNNLLTAIHGFGEILSEQLSGRPQQADAAEVVLAAERGAALTRQLLAFSRRDEATPSRVDMSELVTGLHPLLSRTLGARIDLRLELGSNLPPVLADRGQLEQVILNLALNARDAMPRGGTLTIATQLDGESVRLAVSDTGIGMSPEVKARALEPFFTTKERGSGTGLGLATVWGIVTRAGGALSIESVEQEGTLVAASLPAALPLEEAPPAADAVERVDGGVETVLVVEDEDAVRRLTCRILSDHGYRVLSASDGPEALDLAALHSGPVDLLLTDVVLPSMTGVELAARMEGLRPGLRALAMSGYVCHPELEDGLPDSLALLPKPFRQDSLLSLVRATLEAA